MEIMNVMNVRNVRKKKKGFTLIELIAVIAILAILGVILVPKVAGYSDKANKSKDLTNAKQIITAFEMYNQDHPDAQLAETDSVAFAAKTTPTTPSLLDYMSSVPKAIKTPVAAGIAGTNAVAKDAAWTTLTYANLRLYAAALETP